MAGAHSASAPACLSVLWAWLLINWVMVARGDDLALTQRGNKQACSLCAAQILCTCRVIASMHHKLNFLRNPRYPLPPAVKLLQSQFQPPPAWGAAASSARVAHTAVGGVAADMSASAAGRSTGGLESTGRLARSLGPPIQSNMTTLPDQIFVAEPPEVLVPVLMLVLVLVLVLYLTVERFIRCARTQAQDGSGLRLGHACLAACLPPHMP
jgi:hypothetical protein